MLSPLLRFAEPMPPTPEGSFGVTEPAKANSLGCPADFPGAVDRHERWAAGRAADHQSALHDVIGREIAAGVDLRRSRAVYVAHLLMRARDQQSGNGKPMLRTLTRLPPALRPRETEPASSKVAPAAIVADTPVPTMAARRTDIESQSAAVDLHRRSSGQKCRAGESQCSKSGFRQSSAIAVKQALCNCDGMAVGIDQGRHRSECEPLKGPEGTRRCGRRLERAPVEIERAAAGAFGDTSAVQRSATERIVSRPDAG